MYWITLYCCNYWIIDDPLISEKIINVHGLSIELKL